jgi:hypothetical protein
MSEELSDLYTNAHNDMQGIYDSCRSDAGRFMRLANDYRNNPKLSATKLHEKFNESLKRWSYPGFKEGCCMNEFPLCHHIDVIRNAVSHEFGRISKLQINWGLIIQSPASEKFTVDSSFIEDTKLIFANSEIPSKINEKTLEYRTRRVELCLQLANHPEFADISMAIAHLDEMHIQYYATQLDVLAGFFLNLRPILEKNRLLFFEK